jgi:hypothetical protein
MLGIVGGTVGRLAAFTINDYPYPTMTVLRISTKVKFMAFNTASLFNRPDLATETERNLWLVLGQET